jgi:hypothetical protein
MKVRTLLPSFLGAAVVAFPFAASAHFVLNQPLSWQKQDALGDPQKKGPCGDAGTKTNAVTMLNAGDTVHFDFVEAIVHGGHYRIALGLKGQADLPLDPTVTAKNGVSISVPIQNPPVFPVLADGINPHNASDIASGKKWTYDVKLPAGMTCTQCVLQITQFMTDHGSNTGGNDGFFYHHCATVTILAAGAPADGGAPKADAGAAKADGGSATGGASGASDAAADSAPATGGSSGTGGSAGGTGGAQATGGATGGSHGTGGAGETGGSGGNEDTGGAPPSGSKSSGGCDLGGAGSGGWLALLLALGARRYFRYRARR